MTESMITKIDGLKLIVFDLDYTLWPFWVDTHVTPPFRKGRDGKVYDGNGALVRYYPDVPAILNRLNSLGYEIGIASRTSCTEEAEQLIELFGWNKFISYKEIYPGKKITHMERLASNSNSHFNQICFFDDENRNIKDCNSIGVCSVLVDNGMTFEKLFEGLQLFQQQQQKTKK